MEQQRIRRALISTADKTDIAELADQLSACKITLIATGGTATLLSQHKIPHLSVSDLTHFPEILDGRVKTLHPAIHGGILSRRSVDDEAILKQQGIEQIDLVIVNLYPFAQTHQIEQIDVGGPSMLRAAAKNFEHVTALIDPQDYPPVLAEIKQYGNTTLETRRKLAIKVFQHLAAYDQMIADSLSKKVSLRYGENPHQNASLIVTGENGLANHEQLNGKELSYNNYVDADAAWNCVNAFAETACVIVKHATPCGAAVAQNNLDAYQKAFACDPQSAFGGIIAFNTILDAKTAQQIISNQFVEVILAPDFEAAALDILKQKKNCRVLKLKYKTPSNKKRSISGGELIQTADTKIITASDLTVVSAKKPSTAQIQDLLFAWNIVRFVKSNAIVYAKDGATLGIGAGQTSRIFAAEIAALKAQHATLELKNSVMASDAFFPFTDCVELAAKLGVTAIIQPGGSKADPEVIAAADQFDLAMVFTHTRCFLH